MIDLDNPEVRFAMETVEVGVKAGVAVQGALAHNSLEKRDHSPVTVGDFTIQALVGRRLSRHFPGDPLVAEEDAHELGRPDHEAILQQVRHWVSLVVGDCRPGQVVDWINKGADEPAERFWTLDPIDGTKGFLRGNHWAVCLALIERGQVRLGVLGCPHWSAGEIWQPDGPGGLIVAVGGQGTWWRSLGDRGPVTRLRASRRAGPLQARILRSYESGHTNVSQMGLLVEAIGAQADPILMDSQAKYAALASGQGDMLVRLLRPDKTGYKEKIWDQAAGSLVIEEAGGQVSDLEGRPLDFSAGRKLLNNTGVLASNGLLHTAALSALRTLPKALESSGPA